MSKVYSNGGQKTGKKYKHKRTKCEQRIVKWFLKMGTRGKLVKMDYTKNVKK